MVGLLLLYPQGDLFSYCLDEELILQVTMSASPGVSYPWNSTVSLSSPLLWELSFSLLRNQRLKIASTFLQKYGEKIWHAYGNVERAGSIFGNIVGFQLHVQEWYEDQIFMVVFLNDQRWNTTAGYIIFIQTNSYTKLLQTKKTDQNCTKLLQTNFGICAPAKAKKEAICLRKSVAVHMLLVTLCLLHSF